MGEREFSGGRAVPHGDGDDLRGWGDDFTGGVEEADFQFLFRADVELSVRRDGGDDASVVRGFGFLCHVGKGEGGDDVG